MNIANESNPESIIGQSPVGSVDPPDAAADASVGDAAQTITNAASAIGAIRVPANVSLDHVQAQRDVNVAARDNHVTNYLQGLAHLRPRLISRAGIVARDLFEPPGKYDTAVSQLKPSSDYEVGGGVLVLVTGVGTGSRTEALRLLDDTLPSGARIFELLPDWEEPDVELIPEEVNTGYLLNLSGVGEALPESFREHLLEYAARARSRGTFLILLADERSWGPADESSGPYGLAQIEAVRPSAAGVAERLLLSREETADRKAWLTQEDSVFRGLLTPQTSPGEALRLAGIIAKANDHKDSERRDEYLNWSGTLKRWWGEDDKEAPAARALQLATSFLEACPARVALDATDLLLAAAEVNWPRPKGGPLAGPDAKTRCEAAGITLADDGTVSICDRQPGIDRALLRHVWHTRPQLVPVLTAWLRQISKKKGVASGHLDRLATALTTLAESEGPATILALVEEWLAQDRELAVAVLDDLAVHPVIGPAVRTQLRNWANGAKYPARQRAVVAVCGRRLGRDFPHIALTRLRYVLDGAKDFTIAQEAVEVLAALAQEPRLTVQVLDALVQWTATTTSPAAASRTAFAEVFTLTRGQAESATASAALTLAQGLLCKEGPQGEAARSLLRAGWRAEWSRPETKPRASAALNTWCNAVESGDLPEDPTVSVISAVFVEEADALGDDLNMLFDGHSPVRRRLRRTFVAAIQGAVLQADPDGLDEE